MTFKEDGFTTISDEQVEYIRKLNRTSAAKLLEDGQIPVAEPIVDPEKLPLALLESLHGLGEAACTPFTRFYYIAYTQFDPEILKSWGIGEQHLRVVFGSAEPGRNDDFDFRGYVLINPVITPTSEAVQCISEACGSIEDANISMWVIRPCDVEISAHIWRPGMEKPQLASFKARGQVAGLLEHEINHLDGLTAASESLRHCLIDFRRIPDSLALGTMLPQLIEEEIDFTAVARKIEADWLVWNPERERLEVINYKGDYIRDY